MNFHQWEESLSSRTIHWNRRENRRVQCSELSDERCFGQSCLDSSFTWEDRLVYWQLNSLAIASRFVVFLAAIFVSTRLFLMENVTLFSDTETFRQNLQLGKLIICRWTLGNSCWESFATTLNSKKRLFGFTNSFSEWRFEEDCQRISSTVVFHLCRGSVVGN